jgi:glycosyltransferase involved in cell wall biosynthesis
MKMIYILSRSPSYDEYSNKPRPKWNWDTDTGTWVGIWDYEWGVLIGKSLVKYSDKVDYEVLQTDVRADKIYTAELDERLIQRNFPAKRKKNFRGLKRDDYIYSRQLLEYVKNYNNRDVIFIRGAVDNPFLNRLQKSIDKAATIHIFLLSTVMLLPDFKLCYNPIRLLHRFLISKKKRKVLNSVKHLLIGSDNPAALQRLQNEFEHIRLCKFRLGIDSDYWRPDKTVEEARQYLKIPLHKFVIFLSQRLEPGYQIDKFIQAISRVKSKKDFVCYISGHGTREYEIYLKDLVKEYKVENRIMFIGYVSNEDLKNYNIACDVFATVPKMTGGSNSAIKAMALNKPIMHVTMGTTFEFLRENNAGLFLDPVDYNQWTRAFEEVIDGKVIKTVPREKVVDHFSWKKTAEEILYAIEQAQKQ